MTKFFVVTGTTVLEEFENVADATAGAKELAIKTGKSTQIMNAGELKSRVDAWAQNDTVRAQNAENIRGAIAASAEHSAMDMSANAELERGIRQTYARKYMSSTFSGSKIADAAVALWHSPKHTRVRDDGTVTSGYNILNLARKGAALTAQPGGRRPSQVEWLLLEYARLLLASGKGVKEIVAEVV